MDEYLDAVREVERMIQKAESKVTNDDGPLVLTQPAGVPEKFADHARVLLDLQFLAYRADITRVACFRLARDNGYADLGVPEGHHAVSHHSGNPEAIAKYAMINVYDMSLFASLLEKMRNTPDGDGSLLDHSMLLYGSSLGDGDLHEGAHLPIVVVGGGCGRLKGGRHLSYAEQPTVPLMNLGLSLLDKIGVEVAGIGDSTGRLADF